MKKFLIFLLSVSLTSVIIALSSPSVSAHHLERVLGVSTVQTLSIPPTSDGPGFILPDNPLFFMDRIKQEFRLLLAFTPEQKVKIHNSVAGERLAELQLMLAKNNVPGIRIALQGISDNLKAASEDLADAKLTGRNINLLAKEINDSIKEKQKSLSILEEKANGEIKAQVSAAKESLKVSKVKAEDNLPADLLVNEMEEDLNLEIGDNVSKAKASAAGINRAIEVLTRLASEAAIANQPARQAALTHAIDVKSLVDKYQQVQQAIIQVKDQNTSAKSSISITSPNGGEVWAIGSKQTVTWSGKGIVKGQTIDIQLVDHSKDASYSLPSSTNNAAQISATVTIPSSIPPGSYNLQIIGQGKNGLFTESKGLIQIVK